MAEKLLFIVNPAAGQKRVAGYLSEILQVFCAHGYLPTVLMTERAGHAADLAREYAGDYDLVACAGGDGTLNETISGVLASGSNAPIAYLPCGTTNDLANTLGLNRQLPQAALDAVNGEERSLDIGEFNGRSFVYTASFGAFTKAAYGTPQSVKNALGHLAYVLEGVKSLGDIKPVHARVRTDEGDFEGDYIFGSVSNTTSLAGIITLDKERVMLDDGKFELMLVDMPTDVLELGKLLLQVTQAKFGDMLLMSHASRIDIETDTDTDWTLDGEFAKGAKDFHIRNLNKAVRIMVPRNDTATIGG